MQILVFSNLPSKSTLSEFSSVYQFDTRYVCITSSKSIDEKFSSKADESYAVNEKLYFIAQKGGSFETENPEVSIVLNYGRYLFVELNDKERDHLLKHNDVCWKLEELVSFKEVYTSITLSESQRLTQRTALSAYDFQIDQTRLKRHMNHLCTNSSRFTFTDSYFEMADYCYEHFATLGFEVEKQSFQVTIGSTERDTVNVIGKKQGYDPNPKVFIVCAHLDSINKNGHSLSAPGADDNASGTTGVLEIASQLAQFEFKHSVLFILFGAEELGLHGSRHFVNNMGIENEMLGIINMDMVGRNNDSKHGVLIEGHQVSKELVKAVAEKAMALTDLDVKVSYNPYASDHIPFIEKRLPAILTIEGSDSSNKDIHTERDILDVIDYDLMDKILLINTIQAYESLVKR